MTSRERELLKIGFMSGYQIRGTNEQLCQTPTIPGAAESFEGWVKYTPPTLPHTNFHQAMLEILSAYAKTDGIVIGGFVVKWSDNMGEAPFAYGLELDATYGCR